MNKLLLLLSGCLLILGACKKQEVKDDEAILQYIEDNNLNATKTDEGVYYVITTEGTGVQPTLSNTITMNYEGMLLDGTVFDAGTNLQIALSSLIEGFKIGLPYFKKGGSGLLLIPSALGYGKSGVPPSIPGNSPLVFSVTLTNVQ